MRDLPRGTVTFLFTDIEGSTRLLHELGDGYADALAEHRRALREAFGRRGGVEVDTQGDAFFYAFARASDAVAAAGEGQAALDGGPIRVRMGLHTGEPTLTSEGYVGLDVHRGARIGAAAHGGQVVLSEATARLVDVPLRDLGEHRLKDLTAPQRLYQLGDGEFPRLKTLYGTNLPVPATPFLGRANEVARVAELLAATRLLTLTGPGGSGKTRLALQAAAAAADAFPEGVWWVPLAPLVDAADVAQAAARAIGAAGPLSRAIGEGRMLLLLDNFEHVVAAAPDVARLLEACPNLKILATSRERLRIAGEQAYPVPVLDRVDSRDLFTARALAADPSFEPDAAVDELCERLDDLPLALELAAARTALLSPRELLERLGNRLDLRGGRDTDARQATLRATIAWSYDLLEPEERRLLAALSIFRGGWTLEAAERVCDADLELLASLVDKSLIRRWNGGRFGMLETIREFAAEQLDALGDEAEVGRRHARFALEVAESAGLWPESLAAGAGSAGYARIAGELPNLRAAVSRHMARGELEEAATLAVRLENFLVSNAPIEGIALYRELLDRDPGYPPELRVWLLRCLSGTTFITGAFEEGARLSRQALDEYRRLGDVWGEAHMLHRLAVEATLVGDDRKTRELLEQSLALDPGAFNRASSLVVLSKLAEREGRLDEALALAEEGAAAAASIDFHWFQANALHQAADVALRLDRPDVAADRAAKAVRLSHAIGDRMGVAFGLSNLAFAVARHDPVRAGRLWGAVEADSEHARIGQWEQVKDEHVAQLAELAGPEFERGRAEGHTLGVDHAVQDALASLD